MKIEKASKRQDKEINKILHPLVKEWFESKFPDYSETQLYGVMPIWERKNILISAPTGGTKTLTAFLSILNYLVNLASKNELEDKIYSLYISPLKALNNDIHFNLLEPLEEINKIAKKKKINLQEIRVGLRTGDTSVKERAKMAKKSPHILITTPESLGIMITTKKFIEKFHMIEFLIIDEIHALANKRGVHLSLSVERLEEICNFPFTRIGLSATVAPLEKIAEFLVGVSGKNEQEKECLIADVSFLKKIDVKVLTPTENLIDSDSLDMHSGLYKLIDKMVDEHKTTLIFTNTRAATERVIHHLKEMFPKKYIENFDGAEINECSKTEGFRGIGAHHSSLSKESRHDIEKRLKQGKIKVVVSSTSLELGIDIGYIDLVILLGSPKSIARALQRIGRSGHKLYETAKGRFIVLDRDDLVECSVIVKGAIERKIDKVKIPENCLDVLSQHIYGMAIYKIWDIDEMFNLIKKSYCYRNLEKEDFLSVISYLSGEYGLEDQYVYAKIWYDKETRQIGKKGKLARMIYMTNIGTIPDESFVSVVIAKGPNKNANIGKIDENFLERMKPGDVFVLGGQRYMFLYSKGMKAYVSGSVQRPPTIPSWFSEQLPLSFDLAMDIQKFRKLVKEQINKGKKKNKIIKFIEKYLYTNKKTAKALYDYFIIQDKFLEIPNQDLMLIEEYNAEKKYIIFHSLYGRRVNDALSRAFAYLAGLVGGRDVYIAINDNGFFLAGEKIDINKIIKYIKNIEKGKLRELLKQALNKTETLKRRFRHCAARSLMILRSYKGIKKSAGKQQMKSHFLLAGVKKISKNFPILKEARREVLEDVMDIGKAEQVIEWIKQEKVEIKVKKTSIPSPFALGLMTEGYADLIKIEDKINFLKRMHGLHLKSVGLRKKS